MKYLACARCEIICFRKLWNFAALPQSEIKKSTHARRHFTRRRRISYTKYISQIHAVDLFHWKSKAFSWRRERDSNPCGVAPKRFSRPPRYDRFDIPPCACTSDFPLRKRYISISGRSCQGLIFQKFCFLRLFYEKSEKFKNTSCILLLCVLIYLGCRWNGGEMRS